jgi:hypothetical protein
MANHLNHALLDLALQEIKDTATEIHLLTQDPADFAAVATYSKAHKTFTAGDAFGAPEGGDVDGRKIMSMTITDGTITGDGTVTKWAVVDTTRLLVNGTLSSSLAVTTGNEFSLESFRIELPDH